MPEKPLKNRIITVRLTDEEYEKLLEVISSRGYRNVSELARAGMHSLVGGEQFAPDQVLASRVDEHSARLAAISRELERYRRD